MARLQRELLFLGEETPLERIQLKATGGRLVFFGGFPCWFFWAKETQDLKKTEWNQSQCPDLDLWAVPHGQDHLDN